MRLGIRAKFVAILVIASVLPLLIGLTSINYLGRETYLADEASLYRSMAQYLARHVDQFILSKVDHVHNWVQYGDPMLLAENGSDRSEGPLLDADYAAAMDLDQRWAALPDTSPELQEVLLNPVAEQIRAFMDHNPLYVEIFITDRHGRLVAASNKTSDFWQSDELWWQQAASLKGEKAYVEGIHVDESAGVYAMNIAIPIWRDLGDSVQMAGVIKAVVNASPMFQSITPILNASRPRRDLIYGDGRILIELFSEQQTPLRDKIKTDPLRVFEADRAGWVIAPVTSDEDELAGYAALQIGSREGIYRVASELQTMYVVVHDELSMVMAPFHRQMTWVGVAGGVLILLFFIAGDLIAHYKLIRPLKILQHAAQYISQTAHLSDAPEPEKAFASAEVAREVVANVAQIRTGDEIDDLARDFGRMSDRVLNYHEQMEKEIASKTEENHRDLEIAREFQEALMPETYPQVPEKAGSSEIDLNFYHVYQAASSVGGDFFDIQKINDHCAGIFIADVMGHGARAALITAILRTLIQNLNQQAEAPARFMTLLNENFRKIIAIEGELIFATALYLVVNTRDSSVTYCSAGHMPPLHVDREAGVIADLFSSDEAQCAIGLMPDVAYVQGAATLGARDVLLLYTDGVVEAMNEAKEEYGEERLRQVILETAQLDASTICDSVVSALHQFMNTAVSQDDICLVAVEAK